MSFRQLFVFVVLGHGAALLRKTTTSCNRVAMPKCMSLNLSNLVHSEGTAGVLTMKFADAFPGIDAVITSSDYRPESWEKTGAHGDGMTKINMSPGHTTTFLVSFFDKQSGPALPPCFQFSILDIDCAKNGCQRLLMDMSQFPSFDTHLHANTMLTEDMDGACIAQYYKGGNERSPNPDGLPLDEDEQKNSVEFTVGSVQSFRYDYTPINGTKGSSTYLAGHSGVGPEPIEPTEKCPYGSEMVTMQQFLPTETYQHSEHCPAGKVITVCSNNAFYGMFESYWDVPENGIYGWVSTSRSVEEKVRNTNIFGPNGIIKYQMTTVQINANELSVQALLNAGCDMFWMATNAYDAGDSPLTDGASAFTAAQFNVIRDWAKMSAAHVVLGFQMYPTVFGDYGPNQAGAANPMTATELGKSFVETGPFGDASTFNQAGSWKGRLTTLDEDACVLVQDSNNPPEAVMVLDLEYNAVLVADNGIFTNLDGAMSTGQNIDMNNANDRLFGNFMAFLIGLICTGPPADCQFNQDPFEKCLPAPGSR